jgi:hypothetical protein
MDQAVAIQGKELESHFLLKKVFLPHVWFATLLRGTRNDDLYPFKQSLPSISIH